MGEANVGGSRAIRHLGTKRQIVFHTPTSIYCIIGEFLEILREIKLWCINWYPICHEFSTKFAEIRVRKSPTSLPPWITSLRCTLNVFLKNWPRCCNPWFKGLESISVCEKCMKTMSEAYFWPLLSLKYAIWRLLKSSVLLQVGEATWHEICHFWPR